jgi:hypothetical protein
MNSDELSARAVEMLAAAAALIIETEQWEKAVIEAFVKAETDNAECTKKAMKGMAEVDHGNGD